MIRVWRSFRLHKETATLSGAASAMWNSRRLEAYCNTAYGNPAKLRARCEDHILRGAYSKYFGGFRGDNGTWCHCGIWGQFALADTDGYGGRYDVVAITHLFGVVQAGKLGARGTHAKIETIYVRGQVLPEEASAANRVLLGLAIRYSGARIVVEATRGQYSRQVPRLGVVPSGTTWRLADINIVERIRMAALTKSMTFGDIGLRMGAYTVNFWSDYRKEFVPRVAYDGRFTLSAGRVSGLLRSGKISRARAQLFAHALGMTYEDLVSDLREPFEPYEKSTGRTRKGTTAKATVRGSGPKPEWCERLRRLRLNLNKTIREVAEATGIPMGTVQGYEAGKMATPKRAIIEPLVDYYGSSLEHVVEDTPIR